MALSQSGMTVSHVSTEPYRIDRHNQEVAVGYTLMNCCSTQKLCFILHDLRRTHTYTDVESDMNMDKIQIALAITEAQVAMP